ncbi:hypothetical protein ACTQ5X_03085 [Jeotgalibaca porci]|uniref:hypothetical protein n=1 Tax=Jeotgalibaca TaxID=1470540 RepID=UPI0035A13463
MSHRGLHQKNRMRTTEIYYILHEAIQAHREVAIQIEAIDCNGSYQEDIIGFIKNSDLLGIYIKKQKVHYDEIRNIQFYT